MSHQKNLRRHKKLNARSNKYSKVPFDEISIRYYHGCSYYEILKSSIKLNFEASCFLFFSFFKILGGD